MTSILFYWIYTSNFLYYYGTLTDGSNKKGTSWVQDCLSRGNFQNTSNSEVPSKCIFLNDITPVLIIMFCRISKDFSLLIITHSMPGLAIETLMNLVTGRLESRRARYLSSIPRCESWIDVFFTIVFSFVLTGYTNKMPWKQIGWSRNKSPYWFKILHIITHTRQWHVPSHFLGWAGDKRVSKTCRFASYELYN